MNRVAVGLYHSQVEKACSLDKVKIVKTTLTIGGMTDQDCVNFLEKLEDAFGSLTSFRWLNISKE